jgi:hypothetical protein
MRRIWAALRASAWAVLLLLLTSHPSRSHPLKVALADSAMGVEVGQLLVVSALLPLLWVLRRSTVYRAVVRAGSLAILVVGVLWLYQRVF